MVKLKIYLFRHGQTTFNRDEIFTGWLDAKLTKLGKTQARIVTTKLKNKKFQVAFCTKLSRSKDTLKEVSKYHPECKRIIVDNRMIERNYGKLNGLKHNLIIERFGQDQYDKWHRGFYDKPPKGESFAMVEKRVFNFIKFLKKFMKKNKVSVAISSHGNSIRLFRKILERKSREECVGWVIPYDKVFVYSVLS